MSKWLLRCLIPNCRPRWLVVRLFGAAIVGFLLLFSYVNIRCYSCVADGNRILTAIYSYQQQTADFPDSLVQLGPAYSPKGKAWTWGTWVYGHDAGGIQLTRFVGLRWISVTYSDDSNGWEWRVTGTPLAKLLVLPEAPRPHTLPPWSKKT